MKNIITKIPRVLGQHLQQRAASTSTSSSSSKVIFSGIQPTGIPHLGNYLGALQQWKRMQDEAAADTKLIYSVVDLHAITLPQQVGQLRQWRREMLATLLAIGLDPKRSVIFFQSAVSYANPNKDTYRRLHCGGWMLMCVWIYRYRLIQNSCGF
jgi:tryptophanyl-tRNA synthetase